MGLIAVTDFDSGMQGGEEPFGGALHAFALCAQAGLLDGHLLEVELGDQTQRSTLAVLTNQSKAEPLPEVARQNCPVFAAAASGLRSSVDLTGRAYARMLDRWLFTEQI